MKDIMKRVCLIFVFAFALMQVFAQVKVTMQPVYMFCFSASFNDSTAYMTDIQLVDSAYIDAHGLLVDRPLYSQQFANYLESQQQNHDNICVTLFNTNKSKLESAFVGIRNRYREDESFVFRQIGIDEFRLRPEEYVASFAGNSETPQIVAPTNGKSKK